MVRCKFAHRNLLPASHKTVDVMFANFVMHHGGEIPSSFSVSRKIGGSYARGLHFDQATFGRIMPGYDRVL